MAHFCLKTKKASAVEHSILVQLNLYFSFNILFYFICDDMESTVLGMVGLTIVSVVVMDLLCCVVLLISWFWCHYVTHLKEREQRMVKTHAYLLCCCTIAFQTTLSMSVATYIYSTTLKCPHIIPSNMYV